MIYERMRRSEKSQDEWSYKQGFADGLRKALEVMEAEEEASNQKAQSSED